MDPSKIERMKKAIEELKGKLAALKKKRGEAATPATSFTDKARSVFSGAAAMFASTFGFGAEVD